MNLSITKRRTSRSATLVAGVGQFWRRHPDARNLAEHLGAQRQDEREAVVALHPADRNADEMTLLVQHAATRHTGMPVGEACHQPVGGALSDVAGAQDDSLGVIVAEPEDRLRKVV